MRDEALGMLEGRAFQGGEQLVQRPGASEERTETQRGLGGMPRGRGSRR